MRRLRLDRITPRPRRLRSVFPFRSVVLPWLVARFLLVPTLVLWSPPDQRIPRPLVARHGRRLVPCDRVRLVRPPRRRGVIGEYPFFPLFPAAGGVLMRLGVPVDRRVGRAVVGGGARGDGRRPAARGAARQRAGRQPDPVGDRARPGRPDARARVLRRVLPRRHGLGRRRRRSPPVVGRRTARRRSPRPAGRTA